MTSQIQSHFGDVGESTGLGVRGVGVMLNFRTHFRFNLFTKSKGKTPPFIFVIFVGLGEDIFVLYSQNLIHEYHAKFC